MTNRRWWDVAVPVVVVVVLVISLTDRPFGPSDWGVAAASTALLVWYLAVLRPLLPEAAPRPYAIACTGLVVIVFAGCAAHPAFAATQAVVYPLVWVLACSTRAAVTANVAVAIAVGAGTLLDAGPDGILSALTTSVLSCAFSLALGLWITGIAAYGEERARLLDELQAAQGELAVLHREAGVTDERARLAREIHDTIAQSLTGLVLVAQRAGARLDAASAPVGAAREDVRLIEEMAREALTEARGLVAALAPVDAGGGLPQALRRLAEVFRRETGVEVEVDARHSPVDRELEVVLLRAAQEGLANVRKHAHARHATITVTDAADGVALTVEDDGGGPGDARPGDRGFGLAGQRDRLALVGGEVVFGPRPGGGTTLRVIAPRTARASEGTG